MDPITIGLIGGGLLGAGTSAWSESQSKKRQEQERNKAIQFMANAARFSPWVNVPQMEIPQVTAESPWSAALKGLISGAPLGAWAGQGIGKAGKGIDPNTKLVDNGSIYG